MPQSTSDSSMPTTSAPSRQPLSASAEARIAAAVEAAYILQARTR
jgi:hypothetical protein